MKITTGVKNFIRENGLLRRGDTVLVGVSGGADSLALLHILDELRLDLGIKVMAAHVHHGLRKTADGDQHFVVDLCARHQWPCHVIRLRPPGTSRRGSLEEWAREKRLDGLVRLAKRQKADCVALAHHQDDQAETVLMRIIRGTGLLGLGAMLPKRTMNGMDIIRPLLETRKKDIDLFIRSRRIRFRQDPTNKKKNFLRNRIRLELMPYLQDYNPNIQAALAHLGRLAAVDYGYLSGKAEEEFCRLRQARPARREITFRMPALQALPLSLKRMVIRTAIGRLKGNTRRLTIKHIDQINDLLVRRPDRTIVHLPGDISVSKNSGLLRIRFSG